MRHRMPHPMRLRKRASAAPSRVESRYISPHSTSRNRFLSSRLPPRAATLRARSRLSILHPLAPHPNSTRSILTQLVPSRATNRPRALSPTFSPIFPTGERATTDPGPASCYPLPSRSSLCRNFDFLAPLKSLRILSLSHSSFFCLLMDYFTLVN